jgi:alpha-glucosidase (family GH31 glycosyl hydrolase)
VVWAGDQRTSFDEDDGLPTVVPIMIGLSVAGFPVVTHDIGGYVSATNPNTTKELFFRWTSLGALTPVMRTHHGRDAFLNWRWSSDEETKRHFERWADLHTALFPYWYGLAEEASESGAPIVRPLAFADPGDVRLHGVDDAFTIGDGMLVAPILTSSAAVRSVPLPAGDWYEVLGSTVHHGDVEVALPLGEIGLFARAGAVIPLLDREVESLEVTNEVPDLEDALGSRRIWSFLGGSGTARDGLGGTYRLESPSRPVGEVTVVEGEVVERQIDRVTVRGSRVILQDRDGSTHRITVEGLDGVDLRHVVRW